jgi:ribosomal-protein-alanine N-acetyltransferase
VIRVAAAEAASSPGFWERLAAAQAQAYAGGAAAPYDAGSLRALAFAPGGALVADDADLPAAFALGRAAADEGEVLALAVAPERRRRGLGAAALAALEAALRAAGARRLFLEAAADNAAALALYARAGWREAGLRRGYYPAALPGTPATDALVLVKRV